MIDVISTASSALSALSQSLAVTAGNVANGNTDGYKAQSVSLETGADGQGVQAQARPDPSPGSLRPQLVPPTDDAGVPATRLDMVETSNVDPVRESISMIEASRAFEANVAVIRTQNDMLGTLLDKRV